MATTRYALIVIGTYKDEWWKLSRSKQTDFVSRVEEVTREAGIAPVNGYRLASTPGAFIEVWEGADRAGVDRAVRGLKEMGYTLYVEARWLIGERDMIEEEQNVGTRTPALHHTCPEAVPKGTQRGASVNAEK